MVAGTLGRVGIFGMGLLGGSVALALKEHGLASEVHGYDLDASALDTALALGVVDRAHPTLGAWIADLDVGVLAAPVGALAALAAAVAPWASPRTRLWTDVGSVKGAVVPALERALPRFVGGHPMAGRETPGVQHAFAGLLESAVWVVTPTADSDPDAVAALLDLVRGVGAYPFEIAPGEHDRLVARVSHVPYLLAVALTLVVGRHAERERLLFLSAGGFRDLTRVASGAPAMSRDMVAENRESVRAALTEVRAVLDELEAALDAPDAMLARAREAKIARDALPVVKRALLPPLFDLVVALPDRPLELARLATLLGDAGVNIRDIEVLKVRGTGGEAMRVGVGSDDDRERARAVLEARGYRVR